MSRLVNVPESFVNKSVSFVAGNSTYGKVLCDVAAADTTNPPTFPRGVRQGGQRIFDLIATTTDTSANGVVVWEGVQTTLYANMGVAATTATTNATITRTTGSFITDGWVVGDLAMQVGATTAGNNCNVGVITTVAALTLTMSGVPTGWAAETQGAGFRLIKVHPRSTVLVPAYSGRVNGGVYYPNVQLVNGAYDKSIDTLGIELGPDGVLIVAMNAAVGTLPAYTSIAAKTSYR